MSSPSHGHPIDDEHPPALWRGMWKRFALAAVLIVAISAAATVTVALNTVNSLAEEVFPKISQISAPKGLVTPAYSGGPKTFLVLGSDRRAYSKDSFDRTDPPHSDTILLVRFDPEQDQTSVMSIPRDLMVDITTPKGAVYGHEKINAAYTIGSRLGGTRGGMLLAAETIKKEVFPGLVLNAIVDVNFRGFIRVVDALGCAYVNVDHRYFNQNVGSAETNFTSINLQPGYQKLCYENALNYVRYRHTDSDFVRVARQQDFLRSLRQQISPEDVAGQIDTVAKAVGHAIASTVHGSGKDLIELTKLIVFSQGKPLRQVKFQTTNVNATIGGGSYVLSTPTQERETLDRFLNGREPLRIPKSASRTKVPRSRKAASNGLRTLNLYPTSLASEGELVKASVSIPFRVLYPSLQAGNASQQVARPYTLADRGGHKHHAYVVVWRQNTNGGYYDFEGTDWVNPPLFANARVQKVAHREYKIVDNGSHIHVVGWRVGHVLYWVTNTLLDELSNSQMLAIARSARTLR